ncbi:death-associated protein 1 homolog isoform X1 [Anguilla rostrata]|uniref:death-associated protein 1 homolog isoform X1 n=1 Tax=Anguilla rostrata TaxID=7938 RepID=UPI0030D1B07A
MSSPPKENIETKAGHLPAVKAGGMRIVRKHQGSGDLAHDKDKDKDKDSEEYESSRSTINNTAALFQQGPPKPTVIVSGVVTKGDKDFTPAAAQVAHQKPQPSVEKLHQGSHINQHIHQPRK